MVDAKRHVLRLPANNCALAKHDADFQSVKLRVRKGNPQIVNYKKDNLSDVGLDGKWRRIQQKFWIIGWSELYFVELKRLWAAFQHDGPQTKFRFWNALLNDHQRLKQFYGDVKRSRGSYKHGFDLWKLPCRQSLQQGLHRRGRLPCSECQKREYGSGILQLLTCSLKADRSDRSAAQRRRYFSGPGHLLRGVSKNN